MMRRFAAVAAVASVVIAAGSASQLGGPVSGFLHDRRTGAIRPVNGLPGASIVGQALDTPGLSTVVIRTDLDMAAGISIDSGAIVLVRNLSRQPVSRQYESLLPGVTGLALGHDARRLVAWSKDLLVLTSGLDQEPVITGSIDISPLGEVTGAVLGEGFLMFATRTEAGTRVHLVPHEAGKPGDSVVIGTFTSVSALLLDGSGKRAYIADKDAERIFSLGELSGSHELTTLLTARDGVTKPAALCLSGSRLIVGNSGDSTALLLNLATGEMITLPLPSSPTQCQRLASEALFALNEVGTQPVSLLDAASATSYFIPADWP